jgi:hypothetical protein
MKRDRVLAGVEPENGVLGGITRDDHRRAQLRRLSSQPAASGSVRLQLSALLAAQTLFDPAAVRRKNILCGGRSV